MPPQPTDYDVLTKSIAWQRNSLHVSVDRVGQNEAWAHTHVFHEVVYIESGTVEHVTCTGVQKLHPGDVLIIKPQIWHQYRNPKGVTLINCLFDGKYLREYRPLLAMTTHGFDLFGKPPRDPRNTAPTVLHAAPARRVPLVQTLETMMSEIREKNLDWQATVTVNLLSFLISVAKLEEVSGDASERRLESRAEETVLSAVQYIEAHFSEVIMLDSLAKMLHLSAPYLSRIFSKRMGMGIVQFQHHLRIEQACLLLRTTSDPIGTIAGAVGYDEVAYFSRRFRQEIGLSPRAYRSVHSKDFRQL